MADDDFTGLNGESKKGVLFNREAAQTMADQAAAMLAMVNAAMGKAPQADLGALNQRNSGHELAEKFNAAAKKLVETTLKEHQEVLTEIGESFVGSARLYVDADQASATAFSGDDARVKFEGMVPKPGQPGLAVSSVQVDPVSMPGWGQSGPGWFSSPTKWSGTMEGDYDNLLSGTDKQKTLSSNASGVELDTKAIAAEVGSQYEWDDFHNHWQFVNDSKILAQLESHAQAWNTASAYLKAQAETFKTANDRYLTGYQGNTSTMDTVWASDGAKAAQTGISNYLKSVKTLTDGMDLMALNLAFAQGWLKKLQNFLPFHAVDWEKAINHMSQYDIDDAMKKMRHAWDNWYVEGVKDSSGAVPMLKSPKDAIAVQPQQPGPNPNPNPAGNPSGSPSGNPSGTPNIETPNLDNNPTQPTAPTTPTTPTDKNPTTDTTLQTLITQASTVIQAGITAAEQGAEKIASAITTALTQTPTTTKTTSPTDQLTQQLQNLGLIPNTNTPSGSPTGGSPSGAPTGSGSPQTPKTQLTPRAANPASTTETDKEETTTSRAGLAATTSSSSTGSAGGMGGSPMGAAGAQGQGKEHKRPQFLTNLDNLEAVLGEAPAAVTPVAEK
ncbi:hypothetical protein [Nocardia tengchongensis]|uniref:hypothetical protein n=1 Tax=Nocardia tengchongensis TaxID=2055889 RepID=UPI00366771EB